MIIIKQLSTYLNKPFPIVVSLKQNLIISFLFGLFVYLFLLIFQPFAISEVESNKSIYLIGYGAITTGVMLIWFILLPKIFKPFFNADKWNVGKLLVLISGILFSISILNWLYNNQYGGNVSQIHGLIPFLFITISVGSIPTTFFVFYIENYLKNKNESFAKNINSHLSNIDVRTEVIPIKIKSENKNEDLELDLKQLLCIKSEGNYTQVIFKENENITKKVIRTSITNIEKQLEKFECINRCHRSYIVNFENVINVTGNARNFNLEVSNLDFLIPVSRSFPKSILESVRV